VRLPRFSGEFSWARRVCPAMVGRGLNNTVQSGIYEDGAGDAVAVAESIYRRKNFGSLGRAGRGLRMRQIDRYSV
jgi:hypothetical protein